MRAFLAVPVAGLLAGLIAAAAPVRAENIMGVSNMDRTCQQIYPGASPRSEEIKRVTFVNTRAHKVWPAWITLGGFYSVLSEEVPPGGKFTTYTRVGYHWVMIDGSNWECIQRFTIDAETASYVIE